MIERCTLFYKTVSTSWQVIIKCFFLLSTGLVDVYQIFQHVHNISHHIIAGNLAFFLGETIRGR